MVLHLFHQPDLCLLLYGLVCRSVLADAEGIVRPYELHGHFHEGGHADGRLHVVAEDKERAAGCYDAAMQHHADAAAGHRQLGDTGLQEAAAVVVARDDRSTALDEAVCLVGVAEVGRADNHVGNLLCQQGKTCAGGIACSVVRLLLDAVPVDVGQLAGKPIVQLCCFLCVLCCPCLFFFVARTHVFFQFRKACLVEGSHFGEDDKRSVGVAAKVGDGVAIGIAAEGRSVRLAAAFVAAAVGLKGSLAHDAVTDDEGWFPRDGLGFCECLAYLCHIVAVDVEYFPTKGAVSGCRVFAGHNGCLGGELDVVGIVEHDEVVQPQVACDAGCAGTDFFLYAAVADVGIYGFLPEGWVARLGIKELCSDGCAHGIGVPLSQGTAAVLDAPLVAYFGMSGRGRAPLTELL